MEQYDQTLKAADELQAIKGVFEVVKNRNREVEGRAITSGRHKEEIK